MLPHPAKTIAKVPMPSARDLRNRSMSSTPILIKIIHSMQPNHSGFCGKQSNHVSTLQPRSGYNSALQAWLELSSRPVGIIGNTSKDLVYELLRCPPA